MLDSIIKLFSINSDRWQSLIKQEIDEEIVEMIENYLVEQTFQQINCELAVSEIKLRDSNWVV